MKRNFKIQFKQWHVVVLFVCVLWTSIALLVQSKWETHAMDVNTTLGIVPGSLLFEKDTSGVMDSYFAHSPSTLPAIDIGSYSVNLQANTVSSSPNHRFMISDMAWSAFMVTLQSSALTTVWWSIDASKIGYTGTNRLGTGKTLTVAPTSASDIGTAPVTFVARNDDAWLSLYAQEITLKVNIPAAQKPGTYTGIIIFTY